MEISDHDAYVWRWVLDFLFPRTCVHCAMPGEFLCHRCENRLITLPQNVIAGTPPLSAICSFYHYGDVMKSLMHCYKYDGVFALKEVFAHIIEKESSIVPLSWLLSCVVIPVPLHKNRLRERGFNQSTDIASIFATYFQIPLVSNELIKTKATLSQAQLSKKERVQNVRGSFEVTGVLLPEVTTVVLIDDIFTTGTTATECAKVLKRRYPYLKIYAVTIARG